MASNKKSNSALDAGDEAVYMQMLNSVPIAEFAEYMGGDLDLAVQLRIDEAVSDTYDKIAARQGPIAEDIYSKWAAGRGQAGMDIAVRPIEPKNNLYGFASVTVGGIKIDDFKIAANKKGELFVGMPSKPDSKSETGYRNTVFVDKDFKEDFNAAVLGKYHEAVEQAQTRAASLKAAPEKSPERMAEQMTKAQKEADKHNAALPAQEKSGKKRGDRGD
jgi:DNA-binding cell septation regulator SpoVG